MASTTLITFMLQIPTTVFSVEILGSWDNFSKPYQLKRDRRTGPGQWRGCHTFENITCDGDALDPSISRDGGLKMGGTYWYYYVLDGDVEYHDPAEPSTKLCPLLPGQIVNILDVPVQENLLFGGSRNLSSSSLDSVVFTMNPQDKYLPSGVRRASTTSAVHARKAGLPATSRPTAQAQRNGTAKAETVPQRSQNVLTLERQRSLLSVFYQMRQTRSAGFNAKSNLAWPRKIFSRAGKPTKQGVPDSVPEMTKPPNRAVSSSPTRIWDGSKLPNRLPTTAITASRAPTAFMINLANPQNNNHTLPQLSFSDHNPLITANEGEQRFNDEAATSSVRNTETSFWSSHHHPVEQLGETLSYPASPAADKMNVMALSDRLGRLDLAPDVSKTVKDPTQMRLNEHKTGLDAVPMTDLFGSAELDFYSPKNGYPESLASYAASANFSPCFGSNTTQSGKMSPCHLSQPETPVMSEFGDELPPTLRHSESLAPLDECFSSDLDHSLARRSSKVGPSDLPHPQGRDLQKQNGTLDGFQGYGLPNHDQSSVPTIRKVPSLTCKEIDGTSPFARPKSKQDLINSWNDGSEHHMTALGELVDDLGYLGKLII